jgi:four helix bundle protein
MKLEEFRVYQDAMEMGEKVWKIVMKWDIFARDTMGKQLVRSADSVAANMSEGLGRYHYKETKNFSYYSRGSLFETKTWLTKANNRKLIDEDTFSNFMKTIDDISVKLNNYIRSIGNKKQNE